MALEFNKTSYLKIYTGEDILFEDIPLYKAILREARSLGLAGGTVIKGIEGYASKVRGVGLLSAHLLAAMPISRLLWSW